MTLVDAFNICSIHDSYNIVDNNKFLCRMVSLGFLNKDNATEKALAVDLDSSRTELLDKTVTIFHDEPHFPGK